MALHDVSTFGLSEDLKLGLSGGVGVGSSVAGDLALSPSASLRWAEVWGGRGGHAGLLSLEVSGGARLQPRAGRGARVGEERGEPRGAEWVNATLSATAGAATPKLLGARGGRLVASAIWTGRWWDTQRLMVSLGGESGLRGYPTQAFYAFGADLARLNLEYRSDPLVLSFLHFGGALFYDGGAVYQGARDLMWRQSVGLGARALAPQLNRSVFRLDVGVPLRTHGEAGGWQALLSVSSSQGFALMPWEAQN